MKKRYWLGWIVAAAFISVFMLAACSSQDQAREEARNIAENREYYVMKNDVEYKVYDRRLRLVDNPNTIWWCTTSFNNPSSPIFTVAIQGKLTSGGKRPFPDDPGPDGMYGTSGDYRYGFTPGGMYTDYYNLAVFCTTEPTIWQREETSLVLASDPALLAAQNQAIELMKDGRGEEAQQVLEEAIDNAQGGSS